MTAAPHDHEAERATLAAALLWEPARRRYVTDLGLEPGHFMGARHQAAFAAMLDLDAQGEPVDALLVARHPLLRPYGVTTDQLDGLAADAPPTNDALAYGRRVIRVAGFRSKWIAAQELLGAIEAEDDTRLAAAEGQLSTVRRSDRTLTAEQLGNKLYDWLGDTSTPTSISTGFRWVDRAIGGGLRPGDTTALAAWTSFGKSALADTILTTASRAGHRCHVYVNEMSDIDRGLRMLARETSVSHPKLLERQLNEHDLAELMPQLGRLPFGMTDCSGWTADQVARDILANRWDLACLDLLHNMPHRDEKDLTQAIVTLTQAALTARTHLLVLCQLNDARATGGRLPKAVIRDIRGSGMIRNACATVLLLHREQEEPEPGHVETLPEGAITAGKPRHGPGGTALVEFEASRMRFIERHA